MGKRKRRIFLDELLSITFLIEVTLVISSGAFTYWLTIDNPDAVLLAILQSLFIMIVILLFRVMQAINIHSQEVSEEIAYIKEYVNDLISIQPFDVIQRIKNFDDGRTSTSQQSITSLLSELYSELLVEGRRSRVNHVKTVRYLFINDKIKEFINQVRNGISEGSLTFRGSDSINITKELYSLKGAKIDAVSYPSLEFWKSDQGKSFLNRNMNALDQGVIINRYFLVNDVNDDQEINELRQTLEIHKKFKLKYKLDNYNIYLVRKFRSADIKAILDHSTDLEFSQIPGRFDKQEVPDASLISNDVVSVWNFGVDESDLDEVRLILKRSTVDKMILLFKFFDDNKVSLPSSISVAQISKIYRN